MKSLIEIWLIFQLFKEIGDYEKNINNQFYKFNAYRKAAQSIKSMPHKLIDIEEAKDLVIKQKELQLRKINLIFLIYF